LADNYIINAKAVPNGCPADMPGAALSGRGLENKPAAFDGKPEHASALFHDAGHAFCAETVSLFI
jgi:hypothetical protein